METERNETLTLYYMWGGHIVHRYVYNAYGSSVDAPNELIFIDFVSSNILKALLRTFYKKKFEILKNFLKIVFCYQNCSKKLLQSVRKNGTSVNKKIFQLN